MPRKEIERLREIVRKRVAKELASETICRRCGATYLTFGARCTADLLDRCPGFTRIDEVQMPIEKQVGLS